MEKVIQRRANNGKEKHPKKENKYTQNPEEMLETDLKEEAVQDQVQENQGFGGKNSKRKGQKRKFLKPFFG